MKVASLSLLATILCLQICFAAEPVSIRGTLTITGESDTQDIELQARDAKNAERTDSLDRAQPGKEFALQTNLPLPLVILPRNGGAVASPDSRTFLYGYTTVTTSRKPFAIQLKSLPVRRLLVKAIVSEGTLPKAMKASCYAQISMGSEAGAPVWSKSWTPERREGDLFGVRVVDGVGTYQLTANYSDKKGEHYKGELNLTGDAGKDGRPVIWNIVKRVPSLVVRVAWDEQCKAPEFKPDIQGNMFAHVVRLEGVADSDTLIRPEGILYFYGIKPGEYQMYFTPPGAKLYKITGGTEKVTVVPNRNPSAPPVKMTIAPVVPVLIQGTVLDAKTEKPISDAFVVVSGGGVKTQIDGAFLMNVAEPKEFTVIHSEYYPARFDAKDQDLQKLVLRLKPLPTFSGRITQGGKPCAQAKLRLYGTKDAKMKTDGDGRWSGRVTPGKYRLEIKMHYLSDPKKIVRDPLPIALVYNGSIEIPAEGKEVELETTAVSSVIIDPHVSGRDIPRPLFAALLRESDKAIIASNVIGENRKAELAATEGTYLVFVTPGDGYGALAGKVSVKDGKPVTHKAEVQSWQKCTITKEAQIRFQE